MGFGVHRFITFECNDVPVRPRAWARTGTAGGTARRRRIGGWLAVTCTALLGIGLAAAPSPATTEALAGTPSSVSVPVSVAGGQGELGGATPTVQITVGGWGPLRVALDTGSSGLHVFAGAVNAGSGVTVTNQTSDITYSGGYRFNGMVASAAIQLGAAKTTDPVSFSLVQSATCISTKPDCPAANGIQGFESDRGVDGILGIGLQSSEGGVTSPILGLAGSLGRRWSLHLDGGSGQLVLGARVLESGHVVAVFQLQSDGTSDGQPLWDDSRIPLCLSAGSIAGCVPALFDSGTPEGQISGPPLDQVPVVPGTSQVVPGTPISVAVSGERPFWSLTAGSKTSTNLVRVIGDRGPFFNSGVQAFYDFTVTYNAKKGRVALAT